MKTLIEQIKAQDSFTQFNSITVCVPRTGGRIIYTQMLCNNFGILANIYLSITRKTKNFFRHEKVKSKEEPGVLSDKLKEFSE